MRMTPRSGSPACGRRAFAVALAVSLLAARSGNALTIHRSFRMREVGAGGGFGASMPVDARVDKALAEGLAKEAARPRVLFGRVSRVTGGDSFRIVTGGSVAEIRLEGVAAPAKGQPFGKEAEERLRALINGRQVRVEYRAKDQNGRFLGTVRRDKLDVNERMIADGCARAVGSNPAHAAAEEEARAAKKGLWAEPKADAP